MTDCISPALTIEPNGIYAEGAISIALDIPLATLSRARRVGELRFVRRGRRVFVTGANLLAWLDPSEDSPSRKAVTSGN